jgi:hypothetical protein
MVVLREDKGDWTSQHFAFTVDRVDIEQAVAQLRGHGVAVRDAVFLAHRAVSRADGGTRSTVEIG